MKLWAKLLLILVALIFSAQMATAHFKLNLNVRIIHVAHTADGLDVYLRLPMPYLVADKLGAPDANGVPAPAPFTTNAEENGTLVHYIDPSQFRSDPKGLGKIAADGHPITVQGKTLAPAVEDIRVYRRGEEPGFATLKAAQ